MCDGCCGARLLVIPYVVDGSSPCEFNDYALDHFLNGFFGGFNSSILMEISLVNEHTKHYIFDWCFLLTILALFLWLILGG